MNRTYLKIGIWHSTLQMPSRYIANNTAAHIQANHDLAKKIMSFIQAPGKSNTMESTSTECKSEAPRSYERSESEGEWPRRVGRAGMHGRANFRIAQCPSPHRGQRPLSFAAAPRHSPERTAPRGRRRVVGRTGFSATKRIRLRRRTSGFYCAEIEWAVQGSNLRPLPCEDSTLPLS